jgi:hypothetical protein
VPAVIDSYRLVMVNLHTMYTGLELVTANLYMGAELALLYNDITITTENQ